MTVDAMPRARFEKLTQQPQRDEKGRILKGSTGNPRGRPPKKLRPMTDLELQRDFKAEAEREVDVAGEKVGAIRLVIRGIFRDAIKGDYRARELVLKMHVDAAAVQREINPSAASLLADIERYLCGNPDDKDAQRARTEIIKRLNAI